jgi:hypothetical protein
MHENEMNIRFLYFISCFFFPFLVFDTMSKNQIFQQILSLPFFANSEMNIQSLKNFAR